MSSYGSKEPIGRSGCRCMEAGLAGKTKEGRAMIERPTAMLKG